MPYRFDFDLSDIPRVLFAEITRIAYNKKLHKKIGKATLDLIEKFKIQEATGLEISDAVKLLEDFIEIQAINLSQRKNFLKTKKRAVFLPHCARKYMDNRCKATFDPEIPSYFCNQCSDDCIINKATRIAESKGYDVYVLPGGSCIPKLLKKRPYQGIVGVACGEEIKLGGEILARSGLAAQAIPLIKNGCAKTTFNLETLEKLL
jgi:hypothetical protein